MDGDDPKLEKRAASAERADPCPSQAARSIYEEAKARFRIHSDASESLSKKARNLMITSILGATLLVALAKVPEPGHVILGLPVVYMLIIAALGTAVTIAICIPVNLPPSRRMPIVDKKLLCCDNFDDEAYSKLVENEEGFYRLNIEEYTRAHTKLEKTNAGKLQLLKSAYCVFLLVVVLPIVTFAASVAFQSPHLN